MKLIEYSDCSTAGCRALDRQLIAQIQVISPGALVRFDHLAVRIGSGCHPFLQAPALKALEQGLASKPGAILNCNSAYRTLSQQWILWNHCQHKRCGISAAASPGRSNHESGLALDVNHAQSWRLHLEKFGWDWLGSWDEMHFDFRGPGCKNLQKLSVLAFQKLWNLNHKKGQLNEDGDLGPATHAALMQAPVDGFSSGPIVRSQPTISTQTSFPPLRQGDTGNAVRKLQQALIKKGYKVVEDGVYGSATLIAIKKCQADAGLVADGVVGIATSKLLDLVS